MDLQVLLGMIRGNQGHRRQQTMSNGVCVPEVWLGECCLRFHAKMKIGNAFNNTLDVFIIEPHAGQTPAEILWRAQLFQSEAPNYTSEGGSQVYI